MTETATTGRSEVARQMAGFRKRLPKTCDYCGKVFSGVVRKNAATATCSDLCRIQLYDRTYPEKARERHRRARQAKKPAAALAAH